MSAESRPVDAIAEEHVEQVCRLDPLAATYFGVAGHDHELPDLSPDGFSAREEEARRALLAARTASPTDAREQVAQEAFVERLGLQVEQIEAGVSRGDLSVISSPVHELRQIFDLMDTGTAEAWEAIDARLAGIGEALRGYRVTLLDEAARGHVVAARQYAEVAEQIEGWTGQRGSADVFTTLVGNDSAPATLRERLSRSAAAARSAYAEFGLFLSDEMEPQGRTKEAVGRETYALASRGFLGAAIDFEETYAWGWEELARIESEMLVTGRRILPTADSIGEVVAHLDADPTRRIDGKEAFRDWMQELADRTLDELDGVHFDIPEQIRRIECMIAPTSDGGIYYTGPSEDFSRPGRMWWEVPDGVTSFSPWREVTTVFHEGVPGHHLQVGQTAVRADLLNRWQRLMCWVSGHGEGWALYAERLMDDLGHLADPADRLGMLDSQSFRAARVIVDIGMHLELEIPANPWGFHVGERWTPALGLEFMRQHVRMDDAFIRFEVKRYLGWPGQAPSYKVGERIWLAARDDAQARAGARGETFDLKAFHRSALELGSLGLAPLTRALARL